MNFLFLTHTKSQEHQVFLFWVTQTISVHTFKMLVKVPTIHLRNLRNRGVQSFDGILVREAGNQKPNRHS